MRKLWEEERAQRQRGDTSQTARDTGGHLEPGAAIPRGITPLAGHVEYSTHLVLKGAARSRIVHLMKQPGIPGGTMPPAL